MARDRANINTGIWNDADFRQLSPAAQWLYFLLMTHPTLTYVGVADWRPKRITPFAASLTVGFIEDAASELSDGHYIVIDEDTEEVLIRSFLKHDGILKQPRLAVSMANAYAQTASNTIRGVVVHELRKQREEHPEYKCWGDSRVSDVLSQPSFGPGLALASPSVGPRVAPGLGMHTSTATATSSKEEGDPSVGEPPSAPTLRRKPSRPIPDNWTPSPSHIEKCSKERIDLDHEAEKFRNNALAKDMRYANWDRAFTNWLSRDWVKRTSAGLDPLKDW